MPVIPQLDLLRVADAVGHPAFRAVVFHQHGRGGGEHPVAAGRLGLPVRSGRHVDIAVRQHLPALIHPAGEDQHRAERDGEVERRFLIFLIAGPLAVRQAAPAMVDGFLQPPVQHVRRSQARAQLGTFPVRAGPSGQAVQGRLQRGDPGGEVIAEQMPDRDHARHQRGRGPQVARRGRSARARWRRRLPRRCCRPRPRLRRRARRTPGRAPARATRQAGCAPPGDTVPAPRYGLRPKRPRPRPPLRAGRRARAAGRVRNAPK